MATMLRKFSLFFHPVEIDLSFSPFALRLESDENIAGLLKLEQEVYFGRTPWGRFSFKSELKKHANSLYLVVYQGSTLVGFVGMRMQAQEGHITNIAVKPSFQRRGIGEFLLRTMIEMARKNHAVQMTLEVRSDNYNAQSLYRKLGFKDNFIRKNYYITEQADAVNMLKKLTDKEQEEVN